jgi:hypothetical protein
VAEKFGKRASSGSQAIKSIPNLGSWVEAASASAPIFHQESQESRFLTDIGKRIGGILTAARV